MKKEAPFPVKDLKDYTLKELTRLNEMCATEAFEWQTVHKAVQSELTKRKKPTGKQKVKNK